MSDNGEQRPLTRRERREREMREAELAQQAEGITPAEAGSREVAQEDPPSQDVSSHDTVEIDESLIEVPTVDADGNPLSRREARRLREEAIAALRAAQLAAVESAQAPLDPADAALEEADGGDSADSPTDESDSVQPSAEPSAAEPHDVPTEALSLEDLQLIEADAVDGAEQGDAAEVAAAEGEAAEPAEPADETDEHVADSPNVPEPDAEGYTFPDIKPLEAERPVFDDPALRTVGTPSTPGQGTGFDDMIERAVADESASVHTSTSSLILPTAPGGDDLSGPIGATGELFVTGSFELPKSIGETGGHSGLQDSVDAKADPDEQDPLDFLTLTDAYETSEFDSAPVSASKAVSARSIEKTGITTPEVKHDNKKSLVLMGVGGGLIVVLIGAGIWAVQSGLFG